MTTDVETRNILRDTLGRFVADNYTFSDRNQYLIQPGGFSEETWSALTEFGFLELCVPEDHGGLDADTTTIGVLMEVVGARLMQEPFLCSAVIGVKALARSEEGQAHLADLIAGKSVIASGIDSSSKKNLRIKGDKLYGEITGVVHGDVACYLLVPIEIDGDLALVLAELNSHSALKKSYRLVDGRGAANLTLDGATITKLTFDGVSTKCVLEDLLAQGALALCSEAVGVIKSLVSMTNDYLKVRKQFGRALGANQALQHRMADLYILQEEASAITQAAGKAFDEGTERRDVLVSAAKIWVGRAVQKVANEAVQLHGGLGITEELEVSHYFRRAMVINTMFGTKDEHMDHFVSKILGAA